jgi:hypothetical protein
MDYSSNKKDRLPFPRWWPILAGTIAGIVLRFIFSGDPGKAYSAMGNAFITLAPAVVASITIFVAELQEPRTIRYYFLMGGVSTLFFIAGTMFVMLEGLICAVIISPLFFIFGAIAGVIMGLLYRLTRWAKHALYSIAVLPIVLGGLLPAVPSARPVFVSERTAVVAAPANVVWRQLMDAPDIKSEEVDDAWMYRIGVPFPTAGVTELRNGLLVRHVTMGKGIQFDQVATDWKPDSYVRWNYAFAEASFPPGALDDHVKIGGHYFDLIETEYALSPVAQGSTKLTVKMHYRVSTDFNWYAVPVAKFLIGNFNEQILGFYARRAVSEIQ